MVSLFNLLGRGYFPRELPPPFSTKSFAQSIDDNLSSLPDSFKRRKGISALTAKHNIARVGYERRRLGIPNPITQFYVCNTIENHWRQIIAHIQKSPISLTKPVIDTRPTQCKRALITMCKPGMKSYLKTKIRTGAKYTLTADISKFYHSIYTHSIAWALHGKANIKLLTNKGDLRYTGNRLDLFVRNGQDKQTMGIPIGPDTSLVIAEIILAAIDKTIAQSIHGIKGFRQIDDYELCFNKREDAENALYKIESTISEYELELNYKKTKIERLPKPIHKYWPTWLRCFKFSGKHKIDKNNLISYFSKAFEFAEENPTDSVLRYAIARLRSEDFDKGNWHLFQELLLQCIISEPGTLPFALEQYIKYDKKGYRIDNTSLEEALNIQIQTHAPLGHGSEVAWSLWGAIAFNVNLSSGAGTAISNMEDPVVALLALDANQRGLFKSGLNTGRWMLSMKKESLYEELWLLSYEANIKGWLPSLNVPDHVATDPTFRWLKNHGVHFYDISKAAKVKPCAVESIPGGYCPL